MHKLIVATSAAALLAASSLAALAAEATGAITSIDPAAGTVTLEDGSTYTLASPADVATLQVGDQVTITYEEGGDGTLMASEVMPAS
jgi:Cu/Ag efflux protein CusF